MSQRDSYPRLVKTVVADAGAGHRSALFFIYQVDESGKCEVHEQQSGGDSSIWPESYSGWHQAEGAIYQQEWTYFLSRPVRRFEPGGSPAADEQLAELARLRTWAARGVAAVGMVAARPSSTSPVRIIVADDQDWIRTILV